MYADPYVAFLVAAIVFGFVALMHLLRIIYKTPITIYGKTVPIWVSYVGLIIPLIMSIWMLMALNSL